MAGTTLLGLQNEINTTVGEGGAYALGLVADDGVHIIGGNHVGGSGDDVRE